MRWGRVSVSWDVGGGVSRWPRGVDGFAWRGSDCCAVGGEGGSEAVAASGCRVVSAVGAITGDPSVGESPSSGFGFTGVERSGAGSWPFRPSLEAARASAGAEGSRASTLSMAFCSAAKARSNAARLPERYRVAVRASSCARQAPRRASSAAIGSSAAARSLCASSSRASCRLIAAAVCATSWRALVSWRGTGFRR